MSSCNIILIGLMGVGKSVIGKELADRLSMEFIDTDNLIESKEGKSIREIFDERGESYFRQLEADLLKELKLENTVVSTGGGMPVYHNNMDTLAELGERVYLEITPDRLSTRLWVVRKKRPLLKEVQSIDELEMVIAEQLSLREKFYKKSDFILDVNDKASCEIVEDLLKFVKNLK